MNKENTGRENWTVERYSRQLAIVTDEIAEITRAMNKIDGEISGLREKKRQLQVKHGKKVRYENLLIKNIEDKMKTLYE